VLSWLAMTQWITAPASAAALAALKERRRIVDTPWKGDADLEISNAAGFTAPVVWEELVSILKCGVNPGCHNPERAIKLARFLLPKWSNRKLVTNIRPVSRGTGTGNTNSTAPPANPVQSPATTCQFEVSCPKTVSDYRVVVVGQLPVGHYPGVFVRPRDGKGFWYPQFGEHNPLTAGCAFCCLTRIGNPSGIWQIKKLPLTADVYVCALTKKWAHGSKRLTEKEFRKKLKELECNEPGYATFKRNVRRSSAWAHGVTLWQHGRAQELSIVPTPMECVAPVRFDWNETIDAVIEVRAGHADNLVLAPEAVRSGTRLVLPGQGGTENDVVLPRPGRYRVRLYPQRETFLDSPYECWLDIRSRKRRN
jgi:hypothetical protein